MTEYRNASAMAEEKAGAVHGRGEGERPGARATVEEEPSAGHDGGGGGRRGPRRRWRSPARRLGLAGGGCREKMKEES
jgi:hypothetical protein